MTVTTYTGWLADGQPAKSAYPTRALALTLKAHGADIGRTDVVGLGDDRHLQADPPEDHTPYSHTPWPGPQPYPYVLAFDIMTAPPGLSLAALGQKLFDDKQAGRSELAWLKYMNWTDVAGRCWHDSWKPAWVRTSSTDKGHIHLSGRTDFVFFTGCDLYDPVAELTGVSTMDFEDVLTGLADGTTKAGALADHYPGVWSHLKGRTLADLKAAATADMVLVQLTDAQLDALADKVAARLGPGLPKPLTVQETVEAAFEGAQRAERE